MTHTSSPQTVLITGASGGIGYELARLFAADGYHLVLVARSEAKLVALKKQLEETYSSRVTVLVHDLSQPQVPQAMYDTLTAQQIQIDVLVNNAGFGSYGYFVESNWEKQHDMLELNIVALTHLTRLFLPDMVKRGSGKVLNVASTAAFQPGPLMSVYFATKAYVLSFTEAIANELKGTGVTATALCPGPTASGFQAAADLGEAKLVKGKALPTSEEVARFGYEALNQEKTVVIHGLKNRLTALLMRFLPRDTVTSMVRSAQESSMSV
ncbi:MAG: SDR family oxidoreductase [Elainellaceae cyanobacterium]